MALPALAAHVTGDTKSLNHGTTLATLILRAHALRAGVSRPASAAERRERAEPVAKYYINEKITPYSAARREYLPATYAARSPATGPGVFGHAVSHSCVRLPASALRVLAQVPLGSPVLIVSS